MRPHARRCACAAGQSASCGLPRCPQKRRRQRLMQTHAMLSRPQVAPERPLELAETRRPRQKSEARRARSASHSEAIARQPIRPCHDLIDGRVEPVQLVGRILRKCAGLLIFSYPGVETFPVHWRSLGLRFLPMERARIGVPGGHQLTPPRKNCSIDGSYFALCA
jgi:hypothetical protein